MSANGFDGLLRQNPFPEGDPLRDAYVQWASAISERTARLIATFTDRALHCRHEELPNLLAEVAAALFDVWALALAPLGDFQEVEAQLALVEHLANWATDNVLTRCPPSYDRAEFAFLLRARMQQRKFHWIAETHKRARERTAQAHVGRDVATTPIASGPNPVPEKSDSQPSADLSPDKGARRRQVVEPLLAERGLSRLQWAGLAGVDPSVVYGYLAGRSNPRATTRTALAAALDLPLDQLPR